LKDAAKTWFNGLSPGSLTSPIALVNAFFQKYFPASAQNAAVQKIFDFEQEKGEILPESWTRFCSLIRALPKEPLPKYEVLDIFYNGLTDESKTYLDSCAGYVFRERTPTEAEELMAKISQNHDDWTLVEPTPAPIPAPSTEPTPKKRGMIELNDEVMREAKKSLKEKGIEAEDVKNLPPIEELCKPIPHSSTIEVHSLQCFDERDIPYTKAPDQCLDEFDNFIVKQENFNRMAHNHLLENSRAINKLQDIMERTANDVKILVKHFQMVQTQIDQLTKVQKDLLVNAARKKQACEIRTRSGAATQDPLYPEGYPKRIEQDSQHTSSDDTSSKKKKKHKTTAESSEEVKILTVFLFLMLKLNQEMLSIKKKIKKKLKKNQKRLIRMQSTPKKISLPTSMVKRENLGYRNQCLFLVRNTSPRKKNTTTGFVNG
jgi:hypothetical protein